MKGITMVLAAACMLTIQTAEAHPHQRVVVKKKSTYQRINNGVRTGQLTHREANVLRTQQRQVRGLKRVAAADGRITKGERVIINRTQKRVNRNVYRQKNDRQVRRR